MTRVNKKSSVEWLAALLLLTLAPPAFAILPSNPFGLPDYNGDGVTDLLDLDILGGNFGLMGGATFEQGDSNGDGNVDLLDLDVLGGSFGQFVCDLNGDGALDLLDVEIVGQLDIDIDAYMECCGGFMVGNGGVISTPEPSSALLLALGLAACSRRSRR